MGRVPNTPIHDSHFRARKRKREDKGSAASCRERAGGLQRGKKKGAGGRDGDIRENAVVDYVKTFSRPEKPVWHRGGDNHPQKPKPTPNKRGVLRSGVLKQTGFAEPRLESLNESALSGHGGGIWTQYCNNQKTQGPGKKSLSLAEVPRSPRVGKKGGGGTRWIRRGKTHVCKIVSGSKDMPRGRQGD